MNAILKALVFVKPATRKVGAPLTLPLSAFYRRSDKLEGKRYRFYAAMAREFQFENWIQKPKATSASRKEVGRDGQKRELRISRNNILVQDARSAPFEWLVFNDKLHDPEMNKNIANDRADAGFALRREMGMAEISGLHSPDWMSEPTGNSGPCSLAGTKLDAMESINKLKEFMPANDFQLLERLIWNDEWLWEKGKHKVIKGIQKALDYAAVHYALLPWGEFCEKWLQSSDVPD
ncbi:hypothetical protein ACQU0X_30975 [Pseudovibrio ascidiaceicola]|uniref:hypothetical protein n=1 Tax=Pseudovibrio ascidiaceicola TaxID=285279 RepID=UPI003D36274A